MLKQLLPQPLRATSGKVEHTLILWLCLLFLLVAGMLFFLVQFYGSRSMEGLANNLTQRLASDASRAFSQQIIETDRLLATIDQWGKEGMLVDKDGNDLRQRLLPLIDHMPAIAGLSLADDRGHDFFLARKDDGWLVRSSKVSKEGQADQHWEFWVDNDRQKEWRQTEAFDPRQRDWYQQAVAKSGRVDWSSLYRFHTLQQLGVTASRSWQIKERTQVVAADLLLDSLRSALQVPELGTSGLSFLVGRNNQVSDAQADRKEGQAERLEVFQVYQQVRQGGRRTEPFKALETTWYATEIPIDFDDERLWVGVLLPESEFGAQLNRQRQQSTLIAGAILLSGLAGVILLLRRYRKHFVPAVHRPTLEWLQAVLAAGEGPEVEFKSTMRMNLKSGKVGKEIEIAWLKGVVAFLNTRGGNLLIGVNDDGEILGLEADEFQNEDKCRLHFKNLISQHIGLEFSRYIHLDVVDVDERQVVVVQCDRCTEPVFLKQGKDDEDFYIRSGPASVKLPGSKMLKYLEQRRSKLRR
jgi:hypothetical protein